MLTGHPGAQNLRFRQWRTRLEGKCGGDTEDNPGVHSNGARMMAPLPGADFILPHRVRVCVDLGS